jgi:ferredoxin
MRANYGYQDGSGVYYITIDTDKCNGCGECVKVCPKELLEMVLDDYDELAPKVKDNAINQVGYLCEASICNYKCHEVCSEDAIEHSW